LIVKYKKINDLIFADYNPRKLTKKEHKELKESLTRFGLVDPIIININKDRKNIIVGGHQRVRIWRELGNETIPAVEINLTLDKEKELNVRLNKNVGSWDFDIMANHYDMEELTEWGFKESEVYAEFETKEKKFTPDDCILECAQINKDCMGVKIWENKTGCKIPKQNN
jgi:ParB-like chromosome segregation protein Spo0J